MPREAAGTTRIFGSTHSRLADNPKRSVEGLQAESMVGYIARPRKAMLVDVPCGREKAGVSRPK